MAPMYNVAHYGVGIVSPSWRDAGFTLKFST